MKRIVICCDGTWNTPDKTEEGLPAATNVVKLAEAVPPLAWGVGQRVYYDAGVGTSGGRLRRLFDGATGSGLSKNIRQAYSYLITHYEPGDELYLFGFSRGAFTVRSLAGLVRNSGLLRRDALDRVDDAFELYRCRDAATHPNARESVLFRRSWAVEDVTPIHFIGVWDTVGALGNPLWLNGWLSSRQRFHDTDLSSKVVHACQALAIDERRKQFAATLWHQPRPVPGQQLEQVWFVGVHSNIGGGVPRTGLSDIALEWLVGRADEAGLTVGQMAMAPDVSEPPERSRRGIYRLLPRFDRPIGRSSPRGATHESLHPTVRERLELDIDYRPPALMQFLNDEG
jgi:uncharacterized protein (DUF2235 family)